MHAAQDKHPLSHWSQRQISYYRARADEYDAAYADRMFMPRLAKVLDELPISGQVLELACGTGQWTRLLSDRVGTVTALDAAPEMLDVAHGRMRGTPTRFIEADVFTWEPDRQYDTIFFAFWLSHVPPSEMESFWNLLNRALAPGGRVVFLDDSPVKAEIEDQVAEADVPTVRRRLFDGTQHETVKVFRDAASITQQLNDLGWDADVDQADSYHLVGTAHPRGHE